MKAQMKYADRRNPLRDHPGLRRARQGEVKIKDLIEGAKAAAAIKKRRVEIRASGAVFRSRSRTSSTKSKSSSRGIGVERR